MPPAPTNEVADAALADELLAVALEAAAAAAELIHDRRPSSLTIESKSSDTDQVTQMDRASEALIREIVTDRRPHDVIVGEEGGRVPGTAGGDSEVTWWVDPIDGTTNYMYDHPGYNVSIAAAVGERHRGGRRRRPDARPPVSRPPGIRRLLQRGPPRARAGCTAGRRALVATGFGYDAERRGRQGAVVAALLPQIRDIRRMGAAALDLCSVASGRVDAYYEVGTVAVGPRGRGAHRGRGRRSGRRRRRWARPTRVGRSPPIRICSGHCATCSARSVPAMCDPVTAPTHDPAPDGVIADIPNRPAGHGRDCRP